MKRSDIPTDPRDHAGEAYEHYRARFTKMFDETGENLSKAADRLADWLSGKKS